MEKNGFISLCQLFKEKGWLSDSKHLTVEEKMATFLFTISHYLRNWLIKVRFQHSGHIAYRYFHKVLTTMMKFLKEMITSPSFIDNSRGIRNTRLRQMFKV